MSKRYKKKIVSFLISILLIAGGILYFGLNYVPKSLYNTQTMKSNQSEAYYVEQWCTPSFGKKEFRLWDMTRVDCLTKDYAIEFDFAKKWAESVGQSLYYAEMTHKKPAVVLILTGLADMRYVKRVERVNKDIQIFLIKAF